MKAPEEDIRHAETLGAAFFLGKDYLEESKKRIFLKSWHWVDRQREINPNHTVLPGILMEGFLDEPFLLTFPPNSTKPKALSNVCTHRAAIISQNPSSVSSLICPYHGRQFDLDGNFKFMPGFEKAENFPRECENLHSFTLEEWGGIYFVSPNPTMAFSDWIAPVRNRMSFFPMDQLYLEPSLSREYLVKAHWALYCDNYLEGFHIPFVHPGLSKSLEYKNYRDEIFPWGSLQTGIAKSGELSFDLPPDSPDFGKEIAGYYFWLYPNLMLNFYPWGLSVNIVKPIQENLSRVEYKIFVWKPELLGKGAGADLDKVEREDEVVVESVQKGLQSSFYPGGRFSPDKEPGVHHFHRLLANSMGLGQ
jgi:choline monooxygenase